MKQVLRKGIKEIIVGEVPDQSVIPHHVLIRPLFSLISPGTETASIHQEGVMKEVAANPSRIRQVLDVMRATNPFDTIREVRAKLESELAALGYSGAGVVVDLHPTVTDLKIGDRVAYGGEGTGHGETVLAGRNLVARVPANVAFEHACFATIGSIALNSVRIAKLSLGDTVAVIGMGLIGQLVAQLCRLHGCRVLALDLRPDRVQLAVDLDSIGVKGGVGAREAVYNLTEGKGADCVIVAAAAKSSAPCRQAVEICRDSGRIVVLGAVEMDLPRDEMYVKEIQVLMSRAYGPGSYDPKYEKQGQDYPFAYVRWTENRNMEEFLRQIANGGLRLDPLVSHRFPLEQAAEAYQTIMDPSGTSMAVLLRYAAADEADPVAGFVPRRRVDLPAPAPAPVSKHAINVALIGAGNLARWSHIPNMQKVDSVFLRAVQSGSGVRARNHAERFGAAYAATQLEEVLRDPTVDVVFIMSRNQYHADQTIAALRAGKHVFVEKPMAITIQECRDIVAAERESGRRVGVGFNRRFAPFYVGVKNELRKRSGPVVLNCRMNSPGISGSYWMTDPASGGALVGEGCHFIDLMCWLLESDPVSVSACTLPTGKTEPIGENNITASICFADGSVANLTYCTIGSKTSGGERLEIFGQGFAVETENFTRLTKKGALAQTSRKFFPDKGYKEQLAAFFAALRSGQPQPVSALDGARATITCLKILESSRSHQPVPIDWKATLDE